MPLKRMSWVLSKLVPKVMLHIRKRKRPIFQRLTNRYTMALKL